METEACAPGTFLCYDGSELRVRSLFIGFSMDGKLEFMENEEGNVVMFNVRDKNKLI